MYFEDQLIEHNSDKDRGLQKNKNKKIIQNNNNTNQG